MGSRLVILALLVSSACVSPVTSPDAAKRGSGVLDRVDAQKPLDLAVLVRARFERRNVAIDIAAGGAVVLSGPGLTWGNSRQAVPVETEAVLRDVALLLAEVPRLSAAVVAFAPEQPFAESRAADARMVIVGAGIEHGRIVALPLRSPTAGAGASTALEVRLWLSGR